MNIYEAHGAVFEHLERRMNFFPVQTSLEIEFFHEPLNPCERWKATIYGEGFPFRSTWFAKDLDGIVSTFVESIIPEIPEQNAVSDAQP